MRDMDVNREQDAKAPVEFVWVELSLMSVVNLRKGMWILYGDELHRIAECSHSRSGIREAGKTYYRLHNGVEKIIRSATDIRVYARRPVHRM